MAWRVDSYKIDAKELVGERLRVRGRVLKFNNVQTYSRGDGTFVREYRPKDEILSGLDTLEGVPITIQHPSEGMVTSRNWSRLAKGHVAGPVVDGQHVASTLWIHEEEAIRRVQDADLQELSLGYWAELDETPGVSPSGEQYDAVQRGHRYNHLALLHQGQARGGPSVRILDGKEKTCQIRLDSLGNVAFSEETDKETSKMKVLLKIDGYDFEVEAADDKAAKALERERKAQATAQAAADAARDAAAARADALEAELAAAKEALAKASDPVEQAKAAEARKAVTDAAQRVAGGKLPDAVLSLVGLELKKAALKARGVVIEGKSDAYIEARFDAAAEAAEATPPVVKLREAVSSPAAAVPEKAQTLSLDGLRRRFGG